MSTRVTIADIARASNVSAATVSLALRNKGDLRDETRQRVLDVAQQLGYVHFPSNRAARLNVSQIGVLIKTMGDESAAANNFYGPVLAGIEAICRRHQLHLVYATLPVDEANVPIDPPRLLLEPHVDGLLIVGMQLNQLMHNLLLQNESPVVLVDAYAQSEALDEPLTVPFDVVVTDNSTGAYTATSYLIAQGHRQIAILGSQPNAFPSILERRTGYLRAMAEHGLTPIFWDCPLLPERAYPVALTHLAKMPVVTAVFCCNDAVAIALMKAAHEQQLAIPADLAIIGFDNIDMAQHAAPPLTTMRVDKMGMGRIAAQLLINRIEHPKAALIRTLIRPQLIERATVQLASVSAA